MAPVLSGTPTVFLAASSSTTHTFSYTVPTGSNRRLVVGVSTNVAGVSHSTVTYNGASLTKHTEGVRNQTVASVWTIAAPTEGANNIVVTLSGATQQLVVTARSYIDTDQFLLGNTGTGSVNSTSITSSSIVSATDQMVVDILAVNANDAWTANAGQTDSASNGHLNTRGSTSQKVGAEAVTTGWTGTGFTRNAALAAVALLPSGPLEPIVLTPNSTTVTFTTQNPFLPDPIIVSPTSLIVDFITNPATVTMQQPPSIAFRTLLGVGS